MGNTRERMLAWCLRQGATVTLTYRARLLCGFWPVAVAAHLLLCDFVVVLTQLFFVRFHILFNRCRALLIAVPVQLRGSSEVYIATTHQSASCRQSERSLQQPHVGGAPRRHLGRIIAAVYI